MVLPDEAGMGHAPQSFATAASERIRSGLSPKTIKNSAALLAPTPNPARRVGDVSVVSRARCRSCVAISSARANQRRASARRVYFAEAQFRQIEEKINRYMGYVLDGHLTTHYPQYEGKRVQIHLNCAEAPSGKAEAFVTAAQRAIRAHGLEFVVNVTPTHAVH